MASSPTTKPFYFQPPWNIFFELHKLQKIYPWDIDIGFLLISFIEEMEKRGEIDFRASGVALDSSATIYLMKSRLLLKLEEPPAPPPKPLLESPPPPLLLPLRYELTSTTIQNLLQALDEALKGERLFAFKPHLETILPPPPEILPPVDFYLMEIEKKMTELYLFLKKLAIQGELIVFTKVIAGLKKLEAIKTFITLLFLAQAGKVNLWQDENFSDIYITLSEALPVGQR